MTALVIVLTVIYVIGVLVTAAAGAFDWSFWRGLANGLAPERYRADHYRQEYLAKARAGARCFAQSPLWPLMAAAALVRIYADSKERP